MLNTFLFSAVHLGMQLNTEQDEVEVAHYKPGEEAGDKLIMETGHLSDLLRGKLCPILTPSSHNFSFLPFLPDLEWESSTRLFANLPQAVTGGGGAANGNLPQKLVTRP